MAESRKQWHLACRHFRHNISNIWIYLGFRLDFRLRVYMLKEPLRVLYKQVLYKLSSEYNAFVLAYDDMWHSVMKSARFPLGRFPDQDVYNSLSHVLYNFMFIDSINLPDKRSVKHCKESTWIRVYTRKDYSKLSGERQRANRIRHQCSRNQCVAIITIIISPSSYHHRDITIIS